MAPLLVLHIPGLSSAVAGQLQKHPSLIEYLSGYTIVDFAPNFPAVTCSVQASLTTGTVPAEHGIIANGLPTYLSRADQMETDPANHVDHRHRVSFWEQSNRLVERPRFWTGTNVRTAMLFFQQSMPGWQIPPRPAADLVITPKPEHGPDGRMTSLLWSNRPDVLANLQAKLGPFPLHHYWGPVAGLPSSRWIASATMQVLDGDQSFDLVLAYIPHLDYDFQRFGPTSRQASQAIAELATLLVDFYRAGHRPVLVGEYGIAPVSQSVAPNLLLREAGLLLLKENEIDYSASPAWAMCDHQAAHVYLRDEKYRQGVLNTLLASGLLEFVPADQTIRHRRAGDIQLQAVEGAWCDYRWWRQDREAEAPTFAATVDIHTKPGYDPLELFFAAMPTTGGPQGPPRVSQDASLIRGSHGRVDISSAHRPAILWPKDGAGTAPTGGPLTPSAFADCLKAALGRQTD